MIQRFFNLEIFTTYYAYYVYRLCFQVNHTVLLFHRVQPQIHSPLCDCPHCSRTEVNDWNTITP